MPRALISVSDKTGIVDFARDLVAMGWELVASDGTAAALRAGGMAVTPVERLTGQAELLSGRVKTLHPAIHSGILARDKNADLRELADAGYAPIDLVVCNLYPFSQTIARPGVSLDEAIEQIDIGGVTLLRAAAKNFARVTALCDPGDYGDISAALQSHGEVPLESRRALAMKAFAHTCEYDSAIHAWLNAGEDESITDDLPDAISISMSRGQKLRYGENPHQPAAYYSRGESQSPLNAEQTGGQAAIL